MSRTSRTTCITAVAAALLVHFTALGESGDAARGTAAGRLPLPLELPQLEQWIAKLEAMHLQWGESAVAEELGALYILSGRREAGLRLIGRDDLPPLPPGGIPMPRAGGMPDAGSPGKQPVVIDEKDLGMLAEKLVKSSEAGAQAAGVLLLIMLDKPAAAEEAIRKMSENHPMRGWLRTLLHERTGQLEKAAAEARQWAERLEGHAPLVLHNLCFVDASFPVAYGVYQELAGRSTAPGELALLYVEVSGAKHMESRNGFTVRFQVNYSIVEESGKVLWKQERPDIVGHTTRVPTRDIFLTSGFYVPAGLGAGRYSLRYEVEDLVSGARAVAATPFTVRGR